MCDRRVPLLLSGGFLIAAAVLPLTIAVEALHCDFRLLLLCSSVVFLLLLFPLLLLPLLSLDSSLTFLIAGFPIAGFPIPVSNDFPVLFGYPKPHLIKCPIIPWEGLALQHRHLCRGGCRLADACSSSLW